MTNAIRDDNNVTVLMGISSVDWTPIPIKVNPATGAILAEA